MKQPKDILASELALLHDAELLGITQHSGRKAFDFAFLRSDGHLVTVSALDVIAFRCTDYGMQNVVSRLLVHGVNVPLSRADIHAQVAWISQTSDGEQLQDAQRIADRAQQVLSGECLLLQLEPSWGAQFAALARDVKV